MFRSAVLYVITQQLNCTVRTIKQVTFACDSMNATCVVVVEAGARWWALLSLLLSEPICGLSAPVKARRMTRMLPTDAYSHLIIRPHQGRKKIHIDVYLL